MVDERPALRLVDVVPSGLGLGSASPSNIRHLDQLVVMSIVCSKTAADQGRDGPDLLILLVVGTGVDPVTYRFSGGRSAN